MQFTANFEFTPALQDASLHAYFFHAMLRTRIWRFAVMAAILVYMGIFLRTLGPWVPAFVSFAFAVTLGFWIKTYFALRRQGRAALEILDHPYIEIRLDEEGIRYTSATGTWAYLWNKVRRIIESRDFMILMHGNLPLLSLPKSEFSEEALEFIKQKSWIERKD